MEINYIFVKISLLTFAIRCDSQAKEAKLERIDLNIFNTE